MVIREKTEYTYDDKRNVTGKKETVEGIMYITDLVTDTETMSGYISNH